MMAKHVGAGGSLPENERADFIRLRGEKERKCWV